jgi:hypothetical protein
VPEKSISYKMLPFVESSRFQGCKMGHTLKMQGVHDQENPRGTRISKAGKTHHPIFQGMKRDLTTRQGLLLRLEYTGGPLAPQFSHSTWVA